MGSRFDAMANQLVRMMIGFDGINRDAFQIRAVASVMAKNPSLEFDDYEEAVVAYHNGSPPRMMRASDVIDGARVARDKRTQARMIAGDEVRAKSRKPDNYDEMVRAFTGIVRDFRAQGIDPTNEDILRENTRRIREHERSRDGQ
jgi:hypothetical protein